jgi:hypothetical protein
MIETDTFLEKCPRCGAWAHGRERATDVVCAAVHPLQVSEMPR